MDSKFINSSNATMEGETNSPHFLVAQLVCFIVIAVITTIANLVVFTQIVRRGANRASDILILNLVSSDTAVGVFSIPLDVIERLSNNWPFGRIPCNIIYPLQTALMSVSVITLVVMSLERYRAIATPFKQKPSGRKKITVVIGIWVFSAIIATPYATILQYGGKYCSEFWPEEYSSKIYTVAMFVFLYVIPLSVITIVYSAIGVFLYKHTKRIKRVTSANSINYVKRLLQRRRHRNMKITKVFVAGVVAFAICQLPTHVIWLWYELGNGGQWEHFDDVRVLCSVLTYLNSAIDPFIFGSLDVRCCSYITQCRWKKAFLGRSSSSGEHTHILASSKPRLKRFGKLRRGRWIRNTKRQSVESNV